MVYNSLIWISLLHIAIIEVHYSVPILKSLSPHFVGEYDFLLSVLINALHLAVLPDNLVSHSRILLILIMVLLRELKRVLVFVFLKILHSLDGPSLR